MLSLVTACVVLTFNFGPAAGMESFCVHGGATYKDGDYFPPNDTIIEIEGPQQCVQCRCRQGLVVCEIENCSFLDCETPEQHNQFCCRRCPVLKKSPEENHKFVFKSEESLTKEMKGSCWSSGKRFKDGSVWQPVIGPFGAMACVRCRCEKGIVVCSRLRCENVPCPRPRKEFGSCCPICSPPEETSSAGILCIRENSEFFVFRTENIKESRPDIIEYGFLENRSKEKIVEIHRWDLRHKTSGDPVTVKILPLEEIPQWRLPILGTTTRKSLKKYLRRERRLRNQCSTKCFERMLRLENSLEVMAAKRKSKCSAEEIGSL